MKDGNYTIAAYQKLQLEIMGDLNRKSSIITRIAKGKFCKQGVLKEMKLL